jgi:prepilin-type processing-associated H-X9-DG protein
LISDVDAPHENLRGGYGWNIGKSIALGGGIYEGKGWGYNDTDVWGRTRKKLSTATKPSLAVVSGEAPDWVGAPGNYWDYAYLYSPSFNGTAGYPLPIVGNRHRGSIVVLWADFHVEATAQMKLMNGENGDVDYYYIREK